ncbi:uncharacterized protein LOC128225493 [Mya arenaria]|uniref:uncharacterized protein LOC128225493 n=1 Tax=Mya arenaria TaxID=6604 RepID=UPI0022E8FF6C|nr:uncharacterized protein LOC128225493 [Mya arenaria]
MEYIHLFYGLLFLYVVVTCQSCEKKNSCKCECPGGTIDLSPLSSSSGPKYKDVSAPDGYQYSYNPCDSFTETNALSVYDFCHDVAACQVINNAGVFQFYDTGKQDSASFRVAAGSDVGIEETTEVVVVSYLAGDSSRQTEVVLVCNNQDEQTAFDTLGELPGSNPPFFISCTAAYFGFGILYKMAIKKESGKNVIPQKQFWTTLPGLIKDGVLFVKSRGGRAGYSDVRGGSGKI